MDNPEPSTPVRQVPDVLESTHTPTGDSGRLFSSFRVWVDWVCHNWGLPSAGLFQQPAAVMELDTSWQEWCIAWGQGGSLADKTLWFKDFADLCGRGWGKPKNLFQTLTSSGKFWTMPDAPSGTLGALAAPTREEVAAVESAVMYQAGEQDHGPDPSLTAADAL